jgi:hypothetical protein
MNLQLAETEQTKVYLAALLLLYYYNYMGLI